MAGQVLRETLLDVLRRRATAEPHRLAFRELHSDLSEKDKVTYGDLLARAGALARRLGADAPRGGRALIFTSGFIDYLTAMFACFEAGVIAVSGAPPYPPSARAGRHQARLERLADVLRTSQANAIIGASDLLDRFLQAAPADLRDIRLTPIEERPVERPAAAALRPKVPDWNDLAYLQFTSGSTRAPGGVVIRHGNAASNALAQARALGAGSDDLGVSWLPLFHDYGLVGAAFTPLIAGFPCIFMPAAGVLERPERWLECVSRYGATISWAPDFAYRLCADAGRVPEGLDLRRWRVAVNAAEPVRAETLRRFTRTFAPSGFAPMAFYPSYGLAEATLAATMPAPGERPVVLRLDRRALSAGRVVAAEDAGAGPAVELVGCGRPVQGLELAIVDPASATTCPHDTVGEIWLRGTSVSEGFYDAATGRGVGAHATAPGLGDGWTRTGDMGFLREGQLFIAGRSKDVVIVRGENLYPQDLEATAMEAHPALRPDGTCAIAASGPEGEEGLQLVCEIDRRREPEAAQAARAIRQALAERHDVQPLAVVLIKSGSLPKTSSGKVQRRACRQALLSGALPVVHLDATVAQSQAGERPVGRQAILSWAIARLTPLAAGQPLEDSTPLAGLGLSSLQITELAAAIEGAFGRRIPVAELFEMRTLGDVVVRLAAIPG